LKLIYEVVMLKIPCAFSCTANARLIQKCEEFRQLKSFVKLDM